MCQAFELVSPSTLARLFLALKAYIRRFTSYIHDCNEHKNWKAYYFAIVRGGHNG